MKPKLTIRVKPKLNSSGQLETWEWWVGGTVPILYGTALSENSAFERAREAARCAKWARDYGIKSEEVK